LAQQHALFLGGFRGALALALALSLPSGIVERDAVVAVTFAVVAFSVLIQTLWMAPALRALGLLPPRAVAPQKDVQASR
jgi:CPA1 family monovalent cation:H+ antiporter